MRARIFRTAGIAAVASALALLTLAEAGQAAAPAPARAGRPVMAYVADHDGTVTVINTATDIAAKPVKVAFGLDSVAITPNGKTGYVLNPFNGTVVPIRTATNTALKPIKDPGTPLAIAITP